jgi:hypothetical protein
VFNPIKKVDGRTVVSVLAASYVAALLFAFVPALSPSNIVAKVKGTSA